MYYNIMKGITVPPTFGFSNLSVKGEDRMIISNFKDIYTFLKKNKMSQKINSKNQIVLNFL